MKKTKKSIKISSRKGKGRELQKWVAQKISDLTGIPWGKDCLISSREMGQSGTDVRLIGEARERFPFSVETKRQENWNIKSWIKQAKENQIEGTDWLLFARENHGEAVAILNAKVFFKMLEILKEF